MTVAYMFDNIIRRTIVATIFLLLSFGVAAQVTITGYVYDENRNPITGASVIEKNGSATITDVKGWFKIEVSDKNPLRVDFIGYKSLTIYTEEKDMFIDAVLSASEVESDYVDIDLDIYQKAQKGDIDAMSEVGENYYWRGRNWDGYNGIACDWLLPAAKSGDYLSQYRLYQLFYVGKGVKKDIKVALQWLNKAANQNYTTAIFELGLWYYEEEDGGPKRDYKKAFELFTKAAEQGDFRAWIKKGDCYYDGNGTDKSYTNATECWLTAIEYAWLAPKEIWDIISEHADTPLLFRIGENYYKGKTTFKQDFAKALEWFYKASDKGSIAAKKRIGDCFYYANGVKQDFKEAVKWYRLAATQGDAEAQCALGHCYSMGEGVPYDIKDAELWWTFAANQGNIEAKLALESIEKEKEKGVNPPPSLPTLLTGVSSYSTEYVYEENNRRSEEELAEEIRKALESHLAPKAEVPQLRVLSDAKVTFSDTRQEVRFAISDDTQTIKYRIDGGATTTLSTQAVQAGVCEIELPQRDCLLTMWCVGGEPHTIQYIYDSVSSARKSATLHILAIGLNDYQDPNLGNLSYAEKDARDVISTIQKKHKHTFANIDAQLLVGRDVTSEMITEKINNLADKASASDLAVIFFAGHGLVDERDRYYLSTYNITNASTPRRGGYSASQFVEDISYINCKLLVFIDACYSGKLLEGYRGTVSSENFFREMNNTPNGTCIYTSSNKDVKSKESAKFKHGVFTQALIESFEFENSDIDGDNRISVIEVRNYLEKRIPQLTQNKQKPIYRNVEEIDFPLFIK